MKKITSLLLTAVLLAAMLSVFTLPASAEDAPTEITPSRSSIAITTDGNYIINRDCAVGSITLTRACKNVTLTIAAGVTVTATGNFTWGTGFVDKATLNVYGILDISAAPNITNCGTINVFACGGGKIEGGQINSGNGTITTYDEHNFVDGKCICGTYECKVTGNHKLENGICSICNKYGCEIGILDHSFVNSVCSVCEYECEHDWDAATGKCTVCQYECPHDGNTCVVCGAKINGGSLALGSALSVGNLTIIVGVACLAVGFLAAMFIFKKKKTE